MKVLLVVHAFPPSSQGGSEVYVRALAKGLAGQGDQVTVLTREQDRSSPEYRVRTEQRDGLTIVWINNTFRRTRTFEESYANPAIDAIAADWMDAFTPDVAHIHHLTCLSTGIVRALADRGVPCFMTLHDYWLLCHRGQLLDCDYQLCPGPEPDGCRSCLGPAAGAGATAFAAAAALRFVEQRVPAARNVREAAGRIAGRVSRGNAQAHDEARRRLDHMRGVTAGVTHFLAPSDHLRRRFIDFGIAPDRISLAPYGFDVQPFDDFPRSTSDRLRLGFLGSVMISKAPHLLLEAFSRLPPGAATVDVIGGFADYHGDDSYRRTMAPLLGLPSVRHHQAMPHDAVPRALAGIDALVVPSIWPENSPLVIREAFLAGATVVASRIGGIPEIVKDGVSGLLFRPGDADDLHAKLSRLLNEPDLMPRLRAGRPAVRTIAEDVASTRALYVAAQRPPAVAPKRVAAIVLNFCTPDDTRLAVLALRASRRHLDDLIVVDNDTSGACRQALADVIDEITFVPAGRNLGFSGGMNAGMRIALDRGARFVVLVNSDVIVPPDCIGLLERALESQPGSGIAGPVIVSRTNPNRVASKGLSFSATTGRMRHLDFGEPFDLRRDLPTSVVDAVSGCVMCISRETIDATGMLDEDYFFSFEDLDYCLRARRAGFRSVVAGGAVVYHEGGRSMGPSARRLYFAARNHLLAARRGTASSGRLAAWWRGSAIVALNLAHASISRGGTFAERIGAVARGTRDYLAGRFGDR